MAYTGRCYCNAVQFSLTAEPTHRVFCHCRSCQRASGAPLVAWVTLNSVDFVLSGEKPQAIHQGEVTRHFCPRCGTPLTYEHAGRQNQIDVCLALIEPSDQLAPTRHIWVSHKAPWLVIADGLPQFGEWSPD